MFGTEDADGNPRPFHLYSMKQTIQEGFILDVLKNYVTYKTYGDKDMLLNIYNMIQSILQTMYTKLNEF